MLYYEVLIADSGYKKDQPLTYSYDEKLLANQPVSVQLRAKTVTAFISRAVPKPGFATKPIKAVLSRKSIPPSLPKLADWISNYYACPTAEAMRLLAPTSSIIRRSAEAELLPITEKLNASPASKITLTKEQSDAIKAINDNPSPTHVLRGNTASGKTEVYIQLAKKILEAGQSALILTPEISLTSQLEFNMRNRLNAEPVVLHSHLTVSERKKLWLQILESEKPVLVIGTRSALFAPIHNLGLIIVDECHEPAYKQQQSPHYHAVRVASKLGSLSGAKVVLGSATPDIVDYYVAEQRGAISTMLRAARQPVKAHSFNLELIDLKDRSKFSRSPYLSDSLLTAIGSTLNSGQQALVYLNRRGTARLVMCQNCGWQLTCEHCGVGMVYHGDSHQVICHICGRHQSPPLDCPECASGDISYKSIGTKAISGTLASQFSDYPVQRFDSDNTPDERIEKHYHSLMTGLPGIIVGTQLIAKGFDLPKLGLVGVVIADTALFLPDYRADERTYQLLKQVIGRVGRGHGAAKVVVQAYQADNYALKSALVDDWDSFYNQTITERQRYRYPPFCFLLKLTCQRTSRSNAESAANRLADEVKSKFSGIELVGPTPSFFEKLRGNYRYQIVIKAKKRGVLTEIARSVPAKWTVELDPLDLL